MLDERDQAPGAEATLTDANSSNRMARAASAALAPGAVLATRYRITRFVAGGGMGEVYEARDTVLGEDVALKILRPDLSHKPEAQARFVEEIRLARKVTHANVCRVFDVEISGERVFYTMALHEGDTLADLIRSRAPLSVDDARPFVRQLLAGVAAAHAAEVVHADLKPSNVLLTGPQRDHVVITDFGLAVPCCYEFGCRCNMVHILGTPAYMAPEQVEGGMALERTDVFSLGVILFELVTGTLPFVGDDAKRIAHARLTGETPSPRQRVPALDPTWDQVIRGCLARNPAARPCRVGDIAAALGA